MAINTVEPQIYGCSDYLTAQITQLQPLLFYLKPTVCMEQSRSFEWRSDHVEMLGFRVFELKPEEAKT